jgi:superfamily II DNA/RNA helicase
MEQRQREDALYKFSNGSSTMLVSTDLASRGLDIPHLDNVIHYHLPLNEEALVHRVGRTARWDATGRTFFLIGPDENMDNLSCLDNMLTRISLDDFERMQNQSEQSDVVPQPRMSTIYIGKGKKDKISKGDIVGFLCKIGGLEPSQIGRIDVADRYAYAAVERNAVHQVLHNTMGQKIKGIRTVVEMVK